MYWLIRPDLAGSRRIGYSTGLQSLETWNGHIVSVFQWKTSNSVFQQLSRICILPVVRHGPLAKNSGHVLNGGMCMCNCVPITGASCPATARRRRRSAFSHWLPSARMYPRRGIVFLPFAIALLARPFTEFACRLPFATARPDNSTRRII